MADNHEIRADLARAGGDRVSGLARHHLPAGEDASIGQARKFAVEDVAMLLHRLRDGMAGLRQQEAGTIGQDRKQKYLGPADAREKRHVSDCGPAFA